MSPFQAFLILIFMPIGIFGWLYVYYSIARFIHFKKAEAEADRIFSESVDQLAIDLQKRLELERMLEKSDGSGSGDTGEGDR